MHRRKSWLKNLITLGCIAALVVTANTVGLSEKADLRLSELRMQFAPRAASGNVVLLAIDKRSLDAVGVWPWPRSTYANIVDKLVGAGARDIFLDIDFSARSSPDEDTVFAEALERAGDGVILPTFAQQISAADPNEAVGINRPLQLFSDHAWLASVNVRADGDGIVRNFPYGENHDAEFVMSAPAALAGVVDRDSNEFALDFSIAPRSVPVHSAIDLLEDKLDARAIADKIIVVGASAIELKDNFNVPVHNLISGPMVQILATETLLQQRMLGRLTPWPLWIIALCVGLFILVSRRRAGISIALLSATAVATEVLAFWLQSRHALVLPTAAALSVMMLLGIARILTEIDIRGWLIRIASVNAQNTKSILDQVISDSADAILILDETWTIREINERFRQLFPTNPVLAIGDTARDRLPVAWTDEVSGAMQVLRTGGSVSSAPSETSLPSVGGVKIIEYWVTPSRLTRLDDDDAEEDASYVACITARDITERRRDEDRILYLSRHDVLTGALRPSAFMAELQMQLPRLSDSPLGFAVYAVNLHRFKTINTTLGRARGDALLKAAVKRMEALDIGLSPVARLGGDTFALFPLHPVDLTEAEHLAQQIIDALSEPFAIAGFKAKLGARIGMTFKLPGTHGGAAELVAEAEFALDDARKTSGNGLARFDPAIGSRHAENSEIESELWKALASNQISVLYQPQVELSERRLVGTEALIRWTHPKLGIISPAVFIDIAEANGFVEPLGAWVLPQACRDAMTWPDHLSVAVNVSPLQFLRGDIVTTVSQALQTSGLQAHRLHLEITESTFLDQSDLLIAKLEALKALGVSLALDDFGTGYSSLGYLARFPFDKIKVDQMFIRTLIDNTASQAVVRSVKALAEGLGIKMLCEGIENEEEVAFLKELGCDQGQGYLFGKPLTSETIIAMAADEKELLKTQRR